MKGNFFIVFSIFYLLCDGGVDGARRKLWKPYGFNLRCNKVLGNDLTYIKKVKKFKWTDKMKLGMSCKEIRARGFYPNAPMSKAEAEFPLAYARNVYTDYETIELMLLVSYAPQNHYCFSVDKKQPKMIKKMKQLASCFKNVYISPVYFNMLSNGNYLPDAHYECMKILVNKKFRYLFNLLVSINDITNNK
uniref:Astacin domain-containing protein n=1 Tax=Rhabditophanes sp. KR3021 TaxID=114890 RepID=A0AC35UDT5_9BILA